MGYQLSQPENNPSIKKFLYLKLKKAKRVLDNLNTTLFGKIPKRRLHWTNYMKVQNS